MAIELGDGAIVKVLPPSVPTIVTPPPRRTTAKVLPSPGPQGEQGPEGPEGPPGPTQVQGYVHAQSTQVAAGAPVQINHGLTYKPAGVYAVEPDGTEIDYASITHPLPGVTELTFGVPYSGTVYLS